MLDPETLTPSLLRPLVASRMSMDAAHDWHHIERVFRNGVAIGATEPEADPLVLRAALILHDLGEKTIGRGNALVDDDPVADILVPLGFPAALLSRVVEAINEHSFTHGQLPSSLEAAIVQDADRLDAIGAIGIARAFSYGGAHNRALYDPEDATSSIHHFYDKLFTLRDRMNTAQGRRMAEERHAFMVDFVDQFMAEWAGKR